MLLSPILSKFVHPFDKDSHDSCHTDIDEVLNVLDGLLLIVVQTKLVLHLVFHNNNIMQPVRITIVLYSVL